MSSIRFVIERYNTAHLADIGMLYNQAHHLKGEATNGDGPDPYVKIKMFKHLAQHTDLRFILAYQNIGPEQQKLCGFACIENREQEFFLHDACTITPKGSGVGAAAVNIIFQTAVQEGKSKVTLLATGKSAPFYQNFLFNTVGITEAGIKMENTDITETAELMNAVYSTPKI